MPSKSPSNKSPKPKPAKKSKKYSTFSNETLQHLSNQGDSDANFVLMDRQIVQRMVEEAPKRIRNNTQWWKPGSPPPEIWDVRLDDSNLFLHFEQDNQGSPGINMFLAIDEDTNVDQIKKQWEAICTWRKYLMTWQGPQVYGGFGNDFLHSLYNKHPKWSYAQIAKALNTELQNDLKTALKAKKLWGEAAKRLKLPRSPKTPKDQEAILREAQKHGYGNGASFESAIFRLIPLGYTFDNARRVCEEGLETLQNSSPSRKRLFTPISKELVRERLRSWATKHKDWLTLSPQ